MKIKRFNENEQVDISSERVGEMIQQIQDLTAIVNDKSKFVDSLINELNNFRSDSKRGNDQIDDSIIALQVIKKQLVDSTDKLDTVIGNLNDYNEGGRKYLYSETR